MLPRGTSKKYIRSGESVDFHSAIFSSRVRSYLLSPWSFTAVLEEFLPYSTKKMKGFAVIVIAVLAIAVALPRVRREAYELPDGAELIVGSISTTFSCGGLRHGYYADVDNNCQIFHVCNPVTHADGSSETLHYSFFCGNQTVFNQLTLTCAFPEEAVPCQNARDFYYVNDNIGIEDALFLRDEDVARAQQLINGKK